jgi:transcriptional regulator with XRE-family HTH domain
MKINVGRVKSERQKRAWSQEQLAAAAGLGIRTVQRLETSGTTSNETLKCLAAVFECSPLELVMPEALPRRGVPWSRLIPLSAAACLALAVGGFFLSRANAGELMLNVILGKNDSDGKVFKLLTEEGHQVEASVDKEMKILLTPTVRPDGLVLITAEIYDYEGNDYHLLSTPRVLTRQGVDGVIQVKLADGKDLRLSVNPKKF